MAIQKRQAVALATLACSLTFAGFINPTASNLAPDPATSSVPAACEMAWALTFPTFNIWCGAPGGPECVSVTVVGSDPGNGGTCPLTSCKGPQFTLNVTYNGCAPAPNCCPVNISVGATDVAVQQLAPGNTCQVTAGGQKPGCPGLATTTFLITCPGVGDLLKATLTTECLGC
jgi:hypothetical protein